MDERPFFRPPTTSLLVRVLSCLLLTPAAPAATFDVYGPQTIEPTRNQETSFAGTFAVRDPSAGYRGGNTQGYCERHAAQNKAVNL